ncbi:MAG: caspase family protein, partial [Alphaproteobacteria bacterium]|nr:caspase family protein [Alphaproteobacteria bacterium]
GAENAGPLRRDYELFVRDGEVRSRVGAEGSPGFRYADGQVRSDGTLILEGRGIDQQRRSYTIRFDLRVDGPAISGNGLAGDRPCRLDLARAGGEAPLTQSAAAAPPPAPAPAPASPDGTQALLELALWDAVKGSSDPALYQDYLAKFPKGHFAAVAKSRINELKQPRPAPAAATASAEPAVDIAPELLKEKRLALVIGNGKYRNLGPLRNPANDAKAMATSLKRLDFEVIERVDATRDQMTDAIDEFGSRLQRGGVGVFFFAGHGMQVRGQNYLLPVEANPRSEVEVQGKSINAAYVMEHFAEAKNRVNIMILDACRNNPMQTQFRSAARGLAVVGRAPGGTIIAYATAPDQIAEDGDGSNGLYTSELLRHLETPNLKIEDVFKRVTTGVRQRSDGKQVPWTTGSLEGDFYFKLPGRR